MRIRDSEHATGPSPTSSGGRRPALSDEATASCISEAFARAALPPRYRARWQEPFEEAVRSRLAEGITVLDVGSGRRPAVAPAERPPNTRYVGLDVSDEELRIAGADVYDEAVVADVATPVPALVSTIDLAVSWQVFEHVKPLDVALDNLHSYLKPGGTLVSLLSARWSAFGVVNRLIPQALAGPLVDRVMRRREVNQPVFAAHYHHCTSSGLRRITAR